MTDLIQKARKEWCELHSLGEEYGYGCPESICPPEVVAALLDVVKAGSQGTYCICCGADQTIPESHWARCEVAFAEAAITRALEQKS